MAASDLVLITGGTGFIGIKIIHLALKAGYSVRAAVRSEDKFKAILRTPTVQALNPGSRLSFVIVPNILADKAYDEAVKGVKYIIHGASPILKGEPLAPAEFEEYFVMPALKGTNSILEAAAKTAGIKRIVITSSEVAIIPWDEFIGKDVGKVFDDSYHTSFPAGPYSHPFEAYAASKVRALVATKEFVKERHTEWDIINIMPSFVIGDNELITEAKNMTEGTNAAALAQVIGRESGWGPTASTSVHVTDVARMHVGALDPKIEGNQSFLAVSGGDHGTVWEEALIIVKRNFPQAVKNGILPNDGVAETKMVRVDASRSEKVFGFQFLSYEEQVKSVVKQYLELSGSPVA